MVSLFVNGHLALELTLQAMHLSGEVITTPFTFASTTHAIIRNGLTPVFCDIDRKNYTIDTDKLEGLITERTCAIVPVHVYGNICDIYKIEEIAKRHGLKVVYDAAHAFGEEYEGKGVGTFGNASMFSFHATKVFNTIEGGAVCVSDQGLFDELHSLKDFGIIDEETVGGIGANAKMNEFAAAMGLCNLRHVDNEIAKRKKVYEHYIEKLDAIKGIRLNYIKDSVKSNYAYFPVIFDDEYGESRDTVFERLKADNIFSRKYFYPLTNTFGCVKGRFDCGDTPAALELSKKVLTLPMYADLSEDDIDRITDIIKDRS